MRNNFKYAVYGALIANLILILSTIIKPGSLLFVSAVVAFVCLVTDTMLTIRGNMPVNNEINRWSADNYPENWTDYRAKWLIIFRYRQIANITGFISLLIGAVYGA
jgi:uncharacterized membrane protein